MGQCCLCSERKPIQPLAGSYVKYMSKFDEEHRQVAERKAIDQDVRSVYTLGKKLGEGSFGAVYLATDRQNPSLILGLRSVDPAVTGKETSSRARERKSAASTIGERSRYCKLASTRIWPT